MCGYDYKKLISYSWGKATHPPSLTLCVSLSVCVCVFFSSLQVEYYLSHRVGERGAGLKFCPSHGATEPSSYVPNRPSVLGGN